MSFTARGKRVTAVLLAMVAALVLAGAGEAQEAGSEGGEAENVIIFIGDGMGTSQRDLIRYATVGTEGQLAMDAMPTPGDPRQARSTLSISSRTRPQAGRP